MSPYPVEVVRLAKTLHLQGHQPAEIRRELYRVCGVSPTPDAVKSWLQGAR
jgi:hypothetical protein